MQGPRDHASASGRLGHDTCCLESCGCRRWKHPRHISSNHHCVTLGDSLHCQLCCKPSSDTGHLLTCNVRSANAECVTRQRNSSNSRWYRQAHFLRREVVLDLPWWKMHLPPREAAALHRRPFFVFELHCAINTSLLQVPMLGQECRDRLQRSKQRRTRRRTPSHER
jgi:hypothetical protein